MIFGLTLSSSWGNGHATLWRGLIRALSSSGHTVAFFERNVPYYAAHRDLDSMPGARLMLYNDWSGVRPIARRDISDADAVIISSYCPDARAATDLIFDAPGRALRVFYDLDTPVTLARIRAGESVEYLPAAGLGDFDLVLSYTGGAALAALAMMLGARRAVALYGHVDPEAHYPLAPAPRPRADLSYLGTYAVDRQGKLESLLVEPARRRPHQWFMLGGSGSPDDFPWTRNLWFLRHVAPGRHSWFFGASRLTLNVTRADMAAMGYCPSGRLFEAAACGTALLSDSWEGLDRFMRPGEEILIADGTDEVLRVLEYSDREIARIAQAGRERVLAEHTSAHRARELIELLEKCSCGESFPQPETALAFNRSPFPRSSCP